MQKSKWNYQKQAPEKSGKSKTVPDQSKSIREIMILHSRGITDVQTKIPKYHDEYELENLQGIDVRKLDLVEIEQTFNSMAQSLEKQYNEAKTDQEQKELKKRQDDQEKHKQEIIDQYLKQQSDPGK